MKNIFAMTGNVELFTALANSLINRDRGVDGMGLVFGEPGLGKSRTALWYAAEHGAVYYRVKKTHKREKPFLEGLAREFEITPKRRANDVFDQIEKTLNEIPRLVIIDEVNYLTKGAGIDVVRDLADVTAASFLLVGMTDTEAEMQRMEHLYDRMRAHVVRFKPLPLPDVKRFVEQICEADLDDSAIAHIAQVSGGKLRPLFIEIYKAERLARINSLKTVSAQHLRKAA